VTASRRRVVIAWPVLIGRLCTLSLAPPQPAGPSLSWGALFLRSGSRPLGCVLINLELVTSA